MFEIDKIKHQLILEVLSSHDLILPKKVQKAAKDILELKLNDVEFTRFLIHTYQNNFVGRNSHRFNKILRKSIKSNDYLDMIKMLKNLDSTWPELPNPKNKVSVQNMEVIMKYYKFQNNKIC